MPKIIIDGKEVEFKQGQTIIEAARENGISIPHFCWHPKLSISGNCRVCLVEVEKMPKLVIACSTYAADGMIVHTQSEKTLSARNAVMEFLLINHPLDCPICDEAGECKLQDYAYKHGKGESRFEEIKMRKEKRVSLGPHIMFDAERCILCSRCIRFSNEIAKQNQLTFVNRGDRVTITTFEEEGFNNPYTLNTTDICPVGALTNKDFRFKARVWEMSNTKSICIGCARGCNIEIWVRNNQILRLTPRHNETVNSYWMCDNGRLSTFKFVNSSDRVDGTFIRKEGKLIKVDWSTAVKEAAKRLKEFKSKEIAFIGSAFATVEDNYVLVKIARQLGAVIIYFLKHTLPGDQDDILIREDKTPNSLGAELVGVKPADNGLIINEILDAVENKKIKALIVMEDDLTSISEKVEESLAKLDLLIVLSTNFNKTAEMSDVLFPASTYAEKHGTFVNFLGRIQRIRPAVATVELDRALDGMAMSRWDKFGTNFDRWMQGHKYDAKPSWKILTAIGNELGMKFKYQMSEEVFEDIAKAIDVFKGLDYDLIGDLGKELKVNIKETTLV
ncbi:molybdopterin-dependent oxidoreductase [Melioribacteraceae bacterium 4301-Me]|uniref:molybdopterin-dependent oxidoreductase n=1 Tax=Pyranulibacter aquaticus TaxID=3163344 RepID=UPI0035972741